MTKLHLITFILLLNSCFAQTKQQLINSIIKVNSVHSDCVGIGCVESEQYRNFQKLKNMLTNSELIALTENKNPVIRTYASIEAIKSGKGNVEKLLLNELNRNESVETFEGCIISQEVISSIIYHEYWNQIRIKASVGITSENESEVAMKKVLETDKLMEKLDSLIINTDKEVYWLLYDRSFENRKFKDSYLKRIEVLAFNKNNSYAFEYLNKYYPLVYKEKLKYYLENQFPKVTFKTESEIFYLHAFVELLLKEKSEKYNQIVVDKLKRDKSWKNQSGWFMNTLKEYKIKL
jgi:hypothetical protein